MKSITSFLRRRGYPVREIGKLLRELEPTAGHAALVLGKGGPIEEILLELRKEPLAASLNHTRCSLKEAGIDPQFEHGHTLRVPLSGSKGGAVGYLCFTRVSEDRWIYFVDAQTGD
jgi:hypothetical protein